MKKVFLFLIAVLSTVAFIYVYAQPVRESNVSGVTSLGTTDTYRLAPLKAHMESLEYFNAENDIYRNDSPVSKMSAGFVNTTTGWSDVPFKMSEESEKHNPLVGWTLGFGEGVVSGLARTGAGIIDMATFALPPYDEPLIQPAYKVEKPDEGFKIDLLRW